MTRKQVENTSSGALGDSRRKLGDKKNEKYISSTSIFLLPLVPVLADVDTTEALRMPRILPCSGLSWLLLKVSFIVLACGRLSVNTDPYLHRVSVLFLLLFPNISRLHFHMAILLAVRVTIPHRRSVFALL